MSDRLAIAARPVVYEIEGQHAVEVRRDLSFVGHGGERLSFDLYQPPGSYPRAPAPAVIFVTGYDDRGMLRVMGCKSKEMACYESWGRLVAMRGIAGITYECRQPAADAMALVEHVRREASTLGIDPARIGVWACSGNGPNALSLLMNAPGLAAAAFCYPYLLDLDEIEAVAGAAATFRFVTPAAGRPVTDVPADCPILIVRAGRDEMPGLNVGLDRFVAHALAANRPVTVINYATGPHAFDIQDDSRASRSTVRRVLDFLEESLAAD